MTTGPARPGINRSSSATWRCARPRHWQPRATWEVPALELERLLASNTRDTHLAPATVEAGRGRGRPRERRPVSETAQRSGTQRRGHDTAGATVFAFRRAGGSPGDSGRRWLRARARHSASTRRWTSCLSIRSRNRCSRSPSRLLRKDPRDWEALYRNGAALAALDKSEEAARRFQALLDLNIERRREECV